MELNNLKIRRLEEKDWKILPKWWDGWKDWTMPNRDSLPNNGLGGLIVENDNQPIVAGFIYFTNSKGAWIEWIISDPEYRGKDRQEAIELFINGAEHVCAMEGYKYLLFIGRHKNLIDTFEKFGWHVDKKPSHELIKKI
tara:strand:+ start:307 stop:723 length:417 start_codon:yes stop_codon:yes gene_type:complete